MAVDVPSKPRLRLGPGTHAIKGLKTPGAWFEDGSYFCKAAGGEGITCLPFHWPTALAGWEFWKPWFGVEPDLRDWEIPARNALEIHQPSEVDPIYWPRPSRVHWAVHSHGVNPIIIACALGLRINVLITVSSPVRVDVLTRYGQRARRNIGYHLHFWSANDRTQAAGGMGDGYTGILREYRYANRHGEVIYAADENVPLPEAAGHSGLVNEAQWRDKLQLAFDRVKSRDGRDDLVPIRAAVPKLTRG